jgi:hypothetical protein
LERVERGNLFGFGKRMSGTKDFKVMEIVYESEK